SSWAAADSRVGNRWRTSWLGIEACRTRRNCRVLRLNRSRPGPRPTRREPVAGRRRTRGQSRKLPESHRVLSIPLSTADAGGFLGGDNLARLLASEWRRHLRAGDFLKPPLAQGTACR